MAQQDSIKEEAMVALSIDEEELALFLEIVDFQIYEGLHEHRQNHGLRLRPTLQVSGRLRVKEFFNRQLAYSRAKNEMMELTQTIICRSMRNFVLRAREQTV